MLLRKAAQGGELIRMEPPGGNPQPTEIAKLGSADQRCVGERLRTSGYRRRIDRVVHWIVCDDIDDAGGGVEAEQRGVGPFDDFDLTDFGKLDRYRVPFGPA